MLENSVMAIGIPPPSFGLKFWNNLVLLFYYKSTAATDSTQRFVFVLRSLVLIIFLFCSMMCLCAAEEFTVPRYWSRTLGDEAPDKIVVEGLPGGSLRDCAVYSYETQEWVILTLPHCYFTCSMPHEGKTVLELSEDCFCGRPHLNGYVFNAPLNCEMGGLSVVSPTDKSAIVRYPLDLTRPPKNFCEYFVGDSCFIVRRNICEYFTGGRFFLEVKCVYKDPENIVVSWGRKAKGSGQVLDEGRGHCDFFFDVCPLNKESKDHSEMC